MMQTFTLAPGVTLRCFPGDRFKQGCLSVQYVRPMKQEEAAKNALLPAVLLQGTARHPDLRAITKKLDDLYGASVGSQVRRVGDWQTTGFYCGFIDDRFAMDGDRILAPMIRFLQELLFDPLLENGAFSEENVEVEKRNLCSALEAQRNDKRSYAVNQLLKGICKDDPFGIPRLGEIPQVEAITPQSLYAHYKAVLSESPVELLYVGMETPETVAALLAPLFADRTRTPLSLPPQTGFAGGEVYRHTEYMEVAQGKLCMGFYTPVTIRDAEFVATKLMCTILGGSMNNKLFTKIREKQSLCYDIGASYYGSKGLVLVSAGIDFDRQEQVQQQVLQELEACCRGDISEAELSGALQMLLSQLRAVHDAPSAIEGYYATGFLNGLTMTPEEYSQALCRVTVEEIAAAAQTLRLQGIYFLRGNV